MRIALLASEVAPYAKTGGLADVGGALPLAVERLGHEAEVWMPHYRRAALTVPEPRATVCELTMDAGGARHTVRICGGRFPGSRVPVFLVDAPEYFDRPGLYGDASGDYPDNLERFSVFCRAVLVALLQLGRRPDVFHLHDWQTALVPAYLCYDPTYAALQDVPSVFTIHNLAYQGLAPRARWPVTGLPNTLVSVDGVEFFGQVSALKAGLVYSQALTTVSSAYAQEIQTPEFGCGLDGLLRSRQGALVGILNGIDEKTWNPATDPHVAARYTADRIDGKRACKRDLQRRVGLRESDAPVIGMITRVDAQKGLDLVAEVMGHIVEAGAQFVLLGRGDPVLERALTERAASRPGRLAVRLAFDEALAHQIEAGSDMFLMPSRYEPCGLNQMYSLRYGTVPVVRRTGGLADTVVDAAPRTSADGSANGFVFGPYHAEALWGALQRALEAYQRPEVWSRLQQRGMRQDFSWERSARSYVDVYERAASAPVR